MAKFIRFRLGQNACFRDDVRGFGETVFPEAFVRAGEMHWLIEARRPRCEAKVEQSGVKSASETIIGAEVLTGCDGGLNGTVDRVRVRQAIYGREVDVLADDATAGPEDSMHLFQGAKRIGEMAEQKPAEDDVEGFGGEAGFRGVALKEGDKVFDTERCSFTLGFGELSGAEVDAGDGAIGSDLRCHPTGNVADTAAKIEDTFAGRDSGVEQHLT